MTTPSTARKAGPLLGTGSQTTWPFTFKVFAAGDIQVTIANSASVETLLVLGTDYSVALNANQETSPGGTLTYPISGSPLPTGSVLVIIGDIDYDQALDLPTGGNFNPLALENQLDRTTMQIQQLAEQMTRTVKVPVTSEDSGQLSSDLADGIITLTPAIAEIQAVAADLANLDAVAANAANINTVATNVTDVTNFADVYQGPKASNPTLRNDGSALQLGDLYFSTATNNMRAYGSAGWVDAGTATPVTITPQEFSGNGSTTTFTLSTAPAFEAACDVSISGVAQKVNVDYDIVGTSLVFTTAPVSGTSNIYVKILSTYAGGVPNDGSVTTLKLADDSVTAAKIATGAVGSTELANGAVGSAALAAGAVTNTRLLDANVTTSKLADDAVTAAKIAAGAVGTSELADDSVTAAKIAAGAVGTSELADANVTTAKLADANVTAAKMSGAQSGSAPVYGARAWVNFNGTGTVAIVASGNVSSITDVNTGGYIVNFTSAMPSASYAVQVNCGDTPGYYFCGVRLNNVAAATTTATRFQCVGMSGSSADADPPSVHVSVFV